MAGRCRFHRPDHGPLWLRPRSTCVVIYLLLPPSLGPHRQAAAANAQIHKYLRFHDLAPIVAYWTALRPAAPARRRAGDSSWQIFSALRAYHRCNHRRHRDAGIPLRRAPRCATAGYQSARAITIRDLHERQSAICRQPVALQSHLPEGRTQAIPRPRIDGEEHHRVIVGEPIS